MKTCSANVKDALSISKNFATLFYAQNGIFIYNFQYFINQLKAIEYNAINVKVTVYAKARTKVRSLFVGTEESLIDSILLNSAQTKDVQRSNQQDKISTVTSDISAAINNNIAKSLTTDKAIEMLPDRKTLQLVDSKQLASNNISVPIFQTTKNSVVQQSTKGTPSFQHAVLSLVNQKVSNPFDVLKSSGQNTVTTGKSLAGTAIPSPFKVLNPAQQTLLKNAIGNPQPTKTTNTETLKSDTKVPVVTSTKVINVSLSRTLSIPEERLIGLENGNFFVIFELVNKDGRVIQILTGKVEHDNILKTFNSITMQPLVNVATPTVGGINNLTLKQIDPNGVKLALYRKIIPSDLNELNKSRYDLLKVIDALPNEVISYEDRVNNATSIIYRAIPINKNNILAPIFGMSVSKPFRYASEPVSNKVTGLSLIANPITTGISLEIRQIPPDVLAVYMLRRDLTTKQEDLQLLNEKETKLTEGRDIIIFLDKMVKERHIYEYAAVLVYKNGNERMFPARVVVEHIPNDAANSNISVSSLKVDTTSGAPNVNFQIDAIPKETKSTVLNQLLNVAGVRDLYEDELKKERDQAVTTFNVTRRNLSTGQIENFGTVTDNKFSDIDKQQSTIVSELQKDNDYEYIITEQERAAETLFDDLIQEAVDRNTQKRYSFKPRKYLNPIIIRTGTVVTRASLASNHPEDIFAQGSTGNKTKVSVIFPKEYPVINSATVQNLGFPRGGMNTNVVRWQTTYGDKDKIDHFIVTIYRMGEVDFVVQVHGETIGTAYEFFDVLSNGEIGILSYIITPVYNNFSIGQATFSNEVTI